MINNTSRIPVGRINELTNHGFDFQGSTYFSEGFELFKQEAAQFIGYGFVYTFLAIIAAYIPLGSLLLTPSLTAGFTLGANVVSRRERMDFGIFFKGFDYFLQLLVYTLIVGLISLVALVPIILGLFIFFGFGMNSEAAFFVAAILVFLIFFGVLIAVRTFYIFSQHFIIFGGLEAWQAMETSRKIIAQNFWPVFGLLLVTGIINLLGLLICGLGLIITIPLTHCIVYAAFRDLVHLDDMQNDTDNDILNHLVN